MLRFLGTRFARMILTILVVTTVVFFSTRLSGDAIDYLLPDGLDQASRLAMIEYLGLDKSMIEQYWRFLRSMAEGHFGLSLFERRPVSVIFGERIWPSVSLLLTSFFVTIIVGVPLGVIAAVKRSTNIGSAVMTWAFLGYATPNFVLAILLLLLFSYSWNVLPSAGNATLAHYILPTITLAAFFVAGLTRYTRNAMLDVLSQDFIRTARAKGLSERTVIFQHALRNALIPVITVLGLQITALVSGSVVVEAVFSWRGVGDLLVASALRRDYPVLQFGVLVVASVVVVVGFMVDIMYGLVDPRVRLNKE
jgi:ABC-type dipeptide/oligopeptide/nickel transport system permease component